MVKNAEGLKFQLIKGVGANILGHGGQLMLVENTFVKGAEAPLHKHPHEQVCYVVEGKFEFKKENNLYILEKGDSLFIESNTLHSAVALADSIIIDIFNPQREDFLEKAKKDE